MLMLNGGKSHRRNSCSSSNNSLWRSSVDGAAAICVLRLHSYLVRPRC